MTANRVRRISLVIVLLIGFLLALWAMVQFVLLPRVIPSWQSAIVITAAAILSLLGALGAIAQITGYSLRDFQNKRISGSQPASEIRGLIQAIRANLYETDAQLPTVLSQALELCDRLGYADYGTWIRKELTGFSGYDRLGADFQSAGAFDTWRKEWVPHRMVKTYLKFSYPNQHGEPRIDEWPYEQILVAVPIQSIIEDVNAAKANHIDELRVRLGRLDPDRLEAVRNTLAKMAPDVEAPPDLELFTRRAEYERILFGARDGVSQLLSLASFGGLEKQ